MEIGSGLGYASGPAVGGYLYLVCACMGDTIKLKSNLDHVHNGSISA